MRIFEDRIDKFEHQDGVLSTVSIGGARSVPCTAIFCALSSKGRIELAEQLGCDINEKDGIGTDEYYRTCIEGVYAVGDILRQDVQFAVIAAAQGAACAVRVNEDFLCEELMVLGACILK
jgi:thioredoxin reductase